LWKPDPPKCNQWNKYQQDVARKIHFENTDIRHIARITTGEQLTGSRHYSSLDARFSMEYNFVPCAAGHRKSDNTQDKCNNKIKCESQRKLSRAVARRE
jgi:hypothetical protein